MVWSIFQYENNFVAVTREEINNIPCLKFKPKDYQGLLPTVIYYHGWHSNKDFKRFEGITIASHGYQVIVPDALHHGERDAIDYEDPQSLDKYLWKIMLQSVRESKSFIELIVKEHEADAARIGIIGDSMGAITIGGVFAENPNVKCLVGFNGAFAWEESIKRNYLPATSEANNELIGRYDLLNNLDKLNERAILILHGTDDTCLSIESQRLFHYKVLPLYDKNPEKLELAEVCNVNHSITTGMLERAIMWFKEWM